MPRLPDGWNGLGKRGSVVEGTPFVPAKVPLDGKYNSSIESIGEEHRHDIPGLFKSITDTEGASVSAVVDLTNTNKYYDRDLVLEEGAVHLKLTGITGHGAIPSMGYVAAFIRHVREILEKAPGSLIVVHCTHGHNRTGFMICSYLIRELGTHPKEALQRFYEARPPGIYKAAYIDMLYWMGGCFDGTASLNITYPQETKRHDDETRKDAVCCLETGEVDVNKLRDRTAAFVRASETVFRSDDEEQKVVALTSAPREVHSVDGVVRKWIGHCGFVDITTTERFDVVKGRKGKGKKGKGGKGKGKGKGGKKGDDGEDLHLAADDPIRLTLPENLRDVADPTSIVVFQEILGEWGALLEGERVTLSYKIVEGGKLQVVKASGDGVDEKGMLAARGWGKGKGKGGEKGRKGEGKGKGKGKGKGYGRQAGNTSPLYDDHHQQMQQQFHEMRMQQQ